MRSLICMLPVILLAGPAAPQCEVAELVPPDGATGARYGRCVAAAAGRAILGAPELAPGGAVFVADITTGAALLTLVPGDLEALDLFGAAVATDGEVVVATSLLDDDQGLDAGAAYVFDLETGAELAKLVAPDSSYGDLFGISVAVGGGWICVGADGVDDGASNAGSVYVYDSTSYAFLFECQAQVPVAEGRLGGSVAIDGSYLLAGSWNEAVAGKTAQGAAYVFDLTTGLQLHRLVAPGGQAWDFLGDCVAAASGMGFVGAPRADDLAGNSGAVVQFDLATGVAVTRIVPPNATGGDHFGESVATDGVLLAVGSPFRNGMASDTGAIHLFNVATSKHLLRLESGVGLASDNLGLAVGVEGLRAVGGAPGRDTQGTESGAVHVFAIAGPDCNGNGVSDPCEIASGEVVDVNLDGIPDDCQGGPLWLQSPLSGRWYTLLPEGEWIDHELGARDWGGHLAAVLSEDDSEWLRASFPHRVAHVGYSDVGAEGVFEWVSGDAPGYENWAPGEPDDAPGAFGADFAHLDPITGAWYDEPNKATALGLVEVISDDCDGDGLPDVYELSSGVGHDWNGDGLLDDCASSNYCTANPNSAGLVSRMAPEGSPVVSDNALELIARDLPPERFGYFLFSASTDFVPLFGGGEGNLCLGAPIYRLSSAPSGEVGWSGSEGVISFMPDLDILPSGVVITPGDVWYFQCWFRDSGTGGPTSNTSDGIEILFR